MPFDFYYRSGVPLCWIALALFSLILFEANLRKFFFLNTIIYSLQEVLFMDMFPLIHRRSIRITWYWRKETSTSTLSLPEKHTPTHTSQMWTPTTTIKGITCYQCCLDGFPKCRYPHHHHHHHHLMHSIVDTVVCPSDFYLFVVCYEMWETFHMGPCYWPMPADAYSILWD